MSEQVSGEWLSTSQAAARLGISERAVQKRCHAGKLAARRDVTPQGVRWEIDGRELPNRTGEPGRERTPEPTNQVRARTGELGSSDAQQDANEPANLGREPANELPNHNAELLRVQLEAANQRAERAEGEAEFLRARVSELTAITMQQARALESAQHRASLPAPGEQTPPPQEPQSAPSVPMAQEAEQTPAAREKGAERPRRGRSLVERWWLGTILGIKADE
jgi:hypothetical protein